MVINESEGASTEIKQQNEKSLRELALWKTAHQQAPFTLHSMHPSPFKHKFRGVGSARKIGMDEMIYRYHATNQARGIIISLDADTLVAKNYLVEIEQLFRKEPSRVGCTLQFKHRIGELSNPKQQEGMRLYEQHLHYYKQALQFTGYPHAIYTIGSAFACRADAYVKQGGMPRRQAGEDFYFLHKLTNMGPLAELNSTCVYPSARTSNRVPFGTGPSMQRWLDGDQSIGMSYDFAAFQELKSFFDSVATLYTSLPEVKHPDALQQFLAEDGFWENILPELRSNCASISGFKKRFFQYFNAFKIIQFLNFAHPSPYSFQLIDKLMLRLNAQQ